MTKRTARVARKTRETNITISLNMDGSGKNTVNTPFPFLNHMLELLSRHSLVDLAVTASGDVDVDAHHTVEDIGIVLGQAVRKALGGREGISRYGYGKVPMDEAAGEAILDISGRPYLLFSPGSAARKIQDFDVSLIEDFFQGVVTHAGLSLHLTSPYGRNAHHIYEAMFKAFARALRDAIRRDPRVRGVPSSKGTLE